MLAIIIFKHPFDRLCRNLAIGIDRWAGIILIVIRANTGDKSVATGTFTQFEDAVGRNAQTDNRLAYKRVFKEPDTGAMFG